MFLFTQKSKKIVLFTALFITYSSAFAVEEKKPLSLDEITRIVEEAMPAMIQDNNADLVGKMLNVKLGSPISKNLNIRESLKNIFGNRRPAMKPGCKRQLTASGDLATDECVASIGKQKGRGAYTQFSWSKNLELGNVKLLRRDADGANKPGQLPPVKMKDSEAYAVAVEFLASTMGVPIDEIPVAPSDAKRPFPVRTLAIGEMGPRNQKKVIPIAKVVDIKRGLFVGLKDPDSGIDIPFIPAPGRATVLVTDSKILQASVQNWSALQRSSRIDPSHAKSRRELVREIAASINRRAPGQISKISIMTEMQSMNLVNPHPRKPEQTGLIIPAVQTVVSIVPRDPTEQEQNNFGAETAGFSESFSLVKVQEENGETDDET